MPTRKLGLESQVSASRPEHHKYESWYQGVETRVYAHPDMDARVTVRLDGWMSHDVMTAYARGGGDVAGAWPEFFYAAHIEGPAVAGGTYALAGGKISVSELERYQAEYPGGRTLDWVWSFVLDEVERHL